LTEKKDGTDITLVCTKTLNEAEKADWEKLIRDTFAKFEKALTNAN
jgi:hypothetical protein